MVFGSVTQWNKKREHFLAHTTGQVCMFAEHHLMGSQLESLIEETAPRLGWRAHFAEARPTGRGGTSGGVGIMVRRHLQAQFPGAAEDARGLDWACIGLRVKGCTILFGAVYSQVGRATGVFDQANLERLFQLRAFLTRCTLPFVLAGDWNCTPQDSRTLAWLDDIQADLVLPSDLGFTCTSGEGRVLDFWVVSRSLVPSIAASGRDPEAVWRPRIGLELLLRKQARVAHAFPCALHSTGCRAIKWLPHPARGSRRR